MALSIKKVGVIGAGQMGSGIAHVCALAGFDVKLNDIDTDRIKAGIATINGNMARQVRKRTISEDGGRVRSSGSGLRRAWTPLATAIS
jgi:3-hydroxybutyryl-CoA dehydrogenase